MAVSKTSKTMTTKDMAKVTENKAEQAAVKTDEAKKSEPVKPAEKKVSKTPVKRTTRKTTRTAVKKSQTDVKADVFVQFQGMEFSEKEIMKKVIAAWEAENKKASAIKKVKLYVKPEDGKAYYVINEGLKNGSTGAVDLH